MAVFDVFGRDIITKHWLDITANNDINKLFVVDGIRYPEEVLLYRSRTRFFLIGIDSDDTTRYLRSKSAPDSQKDKGQTLDEFSIAKLQENESFIDQLVSQADAKVSNNCSLDQFHSSLSVVTESFLK